MEKIIISRVSSMDRFNLDLSSFTILKLGILNGRVALVLGSLSTSVSRFYSWKSFLKVVGSFQNHMRGSSEDGKSGTKKIIFFSLFF